MLRSEACANVLDAYDFSEMLNFNVAISGQDDYFLDLVFGPQMAYEGLAFFTRPIVKADQPGGRAIYDDDALHAWSRSRQQVGQFTAQLAPSSNQDTFSINQASQAFARFFTDVFDIPQRDVALLRGVQKRSRERVLGILFEAGAVPENLFLAHAGEPDDLRNDRLTMCQGSGFIKEHGADIPDPFEDDRLFDHDARVSQPTIWTR